jgi:hypothetical protein
MLSYVDAHATEWSVNDEDFQASFALDAAAIRCTDGLRVHTCDRRVSAELVAILAGQALPGLRHLHVEITTTRNVLGVISDLLAKGNLPALETLALYVHPVPATQTMLGLVRALAKPKAPVALRRVATLAEKVEGTALAAAVASVLEARAARGLPAMDLRVGNWVRFPDIAPHIYATSLKVMNAWEVNIVEPNDQAGLGALGAAVASSTGPLPVRFFHVMNQWHPNLVTPPPRYVPVPEVLVEAMRGGRLPELRHVIFRCVAFPVPISGLMEALGRLPGLVFVELSDCTFLDDGVAGPVAADAAWTCVARAINFYTRSPAAAQRVASGLMAAGLAGGFPHAQCVYVALPAHDGGWDKWDPVHNNWLCGRNAELVGWSDCPCCVVKLHEAEEIFAGVV